MQNVGKGGARVEEEWPLLFWWTVGDITENVKSRLKKKKKANNDNVEVSGKIPRSVKA